MACRLRPNSLGPWTRHPSSNQTASDRTSKLRLDIPFQKRISLLRPYTQAQTGQAQLQTRHPRSDWTSQLMPDSLGPDIQAQSRQPQTALRHAGHSSPDRTSRFRSDVSPQTEQPQTRHSSSHCAAIASDRTFQHKPDSSRPAKLRLDRFRPDTPAQIGNHQWTGSDQTFQRRLENIKSYCQAQAEHPSLRLDLTRASKLRPDRPALTGYLPSADGRSLVR